MLIFSSVQIRLMTIFINVFFQKYENFRKLQKNISASKMKNIIQNVITKWNNTFHMLQKINKMKEIIKSWLDDDSVKLHILWLFKVKWKQINFIVKLLRSFQKIIETLNSFINFFIHKIWIVYNVVHAHLKCRTIQIRTWARIIWTNSLLTAIKTAQVKLWKYYNVTFEKADIYFNINLCLNLCDKLNYYSICQFSFTTALYRLLCRWHIILMKLIMLKFLTNRYEIEKIIKLSFVHIMRINIYHYKLINIVQ